MAVLVVVLGLQRLCAGRKWRYQPDSAIRSAPDHLSPQTTLVFVVVLASCVICILSWCDVIILLLLVLPFISSELISSDICFGRCQRLHCTPTINVRLLHNCDNRVYLNAVSTFFTYLPLGEASEQ